MDWPNKRPRLTSVAPSQVSYQSTATDGPNKRPRLTYVVPPDVNYEDFDLHTAQLRNDRRLKSKFESIFYKYERDFTGVGDEIDLETGEIVVDNGHITGMRDEQDVGEVVQNTEMSGSSLLRALTTAPEDDDARAQSRNAQTNGISLMRALTVAPEDPEAPFRSVELDDHEELSEEANSLASDALDEAGNAQGYSSENEDEESLGIDGEDEAGDDSSDSDDSILGPKKNRRPLRDVDLMPPHSIDHPTLNSRFHNLNRQEPAPPIGGPSLEVASDPIWCVPPLPGDVSRIAPRNNSRERSRSLSYTSPNNKSLWAPVYTRKPRRKKNDNGPSPAPDGPQNHRRESLMGRSSDSTNVLQTDEESDDPLQDVLVTIPASSMKSSGVVFIGQKAATLENSNLPQAISKVSEVMISNRIEPKEEHDSPGDTRHQKVTGGSPVPSRGYHVEPGPGIATHMISRNHGSSAEPERYSNGAERSQPGEVISSPPNDSHGSATEIRGSVEAILKEPDGANGSTTDRADQSNGKRNPQHPARAWSSGAFKHRRLTKEQDEYLVRLRGQGLKWTEITKSFPPGFGICKLQDRYYNYLSPSAVEKKRQGPRRKHIAIRASSVLSFASSDGHNTGLTNGNRETASVDTTGEIPTTPLLRSVIEPFLNCSDPPHGNSQDGIETGGVHETDQQPYMSGSSPARSTCRDSVEKDIYTSRTHKSDQMPNKSGSSPKAIEGNSHSRSHGDDREIGHATKFSPTFGEPDSTVPRDVEYTVTDNASLTISAKQIVSSVKDGPNSTNQPSLGMALHNFLPRTYQSPYAPIVYDPALDVVYDDEGTRRYRRLMPMPSKTGEAVGQSVAPNVVPSLNEAAANGGYGFILDYGRRSYLKHVKSTERFAGKNVIDFIEGNSDRSSQRSGTASTQEVGQDGNENIDPRLLDRKVLSYKEKLRQNQKRPRRMSSVDQDSSGEGQRKISRLRVRSRDRNRDWQALIGSSASPQPFQNFSISRPSTAVSSVSSGSLWGEE